MYRKSTHFIMYYPILLFTSAPLQPPSGSGDLEAHMDSLTLQDASAGLYGEGQPGTHEADETKGFDIADVAWLTNPTDFKSPRMGRTYVEEGNIYTWIHAHIYGTRM